MKKAFKSVVFAAAAVAALASCNKEDINIQDPVKNDAITVNVTAYAPGYSDTKANLQGDYSFLWSGYDEELIMVETISGKELSLSQSFSSSQYDLLDDGVRISFSVNVPTAQQLINDYYFLPYGDLLEEEGLKYSYGFIATDTDAYYYDYDLSTNEVIFQVPFNQQYFNNAVSKVDPKAIYVYAYQEEQDQRFAFQNTYDAGFSYKHVNAYARIKFTDVPEGFTPAHPAQTIVEAYFYDGVDENPAPLKASGYFAFNYVTGEYYDIYQNGNDSYVFTTIDDPEIREVWFSVIPGMFEKGTMLLTITKPDLYNPDNSTKWIKKIKIDSPFKPGKIKVFDVAITDADALG